MLKLIDGTVSDISRGSETVGGGTTGRHGSVKIESQQFLLFRLDNMPVILKSQGTMFSVKEGERVVVAGPVKGGQVEAFSIHNLSSGAHEHKPIMRGIILAVLLFILGLPLSLIIIGIPFLALGAYVSYRVWLFIRSKSMLESHLLRNGQPASS